MNWRTLLPNLFTLGNLSLGVVGIIFSFQMGLAAAAICMLLGGVLDFFDRFVARLTKGASELGKQLDSLADMITFGALPGIMMFHYISITLGDYFTPIADRDPGHLAIELIALMITCFSALRLAKFNIDDSQSDHFIGVPTPANALIVASVAIIMEMQYNLNFYAPIQTEEAMRALVAANRHWTSFDFHLVFAFTETVTYVIGTIFLSLMLVAPVKMLNFKFKTWGWSANKERYVFLILVGLLLLATALPYMIRIKGYPFFDAAIVLIILLLYVIYSLVLNLINLVKR